jgi:tetratricopeptide (TPR) repeat protein
LAKALQLKALALHELDRSHEALDLLRNVGDAPPEDHVLLLVQALLWFDLGDLEQAARAIGNARLLTHRENFVVRGMERLILSGTGEEGGGLREFATCPSMYNEFVGPRLLLVLEEQVIRHRDSLDLARTRWAKLLEEPPPARPRSWRTHLPFLLLRVPILVLQSVLGRPILPLKVEAAYLRGDAREARRVLLEETPPAVAQKEHVRDWLALLSMDLEEYAEALRHLPPRGKEPDSMREFVRGYCQLHLGKWRKAERAFADAAAQPGAWYYRGLCHVALGDRAGARRAFTREIRRDDIGVAERILIAGRTLKVFPQGYAP